MSEQPAREPVVVRPDTAEHLRRLGVDEALFVVSEPVPAKPSPAEVMRPTPNRRSKRAGAKFTRKVMAEVRRRKLAKDAKGPRG